MQCRQLKPVRNLNAVMPHVVPSRPSTRPIKKLVLNQIYAGTSDPSGMAGFCGFMFGAIILFNPIPTPSINARSIPQPMAELRADLRPPRMARAPPVKKPAMTRMLVSKDCYDKIGTHEGKVTHWHCRGLPSS